MHFKHHAQAGMVMINMPTAGVDDHVSFGGRKGSSYGRASRGGTRASSILLSKQSMSIREK
jgi:acyl-CoA reductase-like NAD-dependent aldehyde dehydrogenase